MLHFLSLLPILLDVVQIVFISLTIFLGNMIWASLVYLIGALSRCRVIHKIYTIILDVQFGLRQIHDDLKILMM